MTIWKYLNCLAPWINISEPLLCVFDVLVKLVLNDSFVVKIAWRICDVFCTNILIPFLESNFFVNGYYDFLLYVSIRGASILTKLMLSKDFNAIRYFYFDTTKMIWTSMKNISGRLQNRKTLSWFLFVNRKNPWVWKNIISSALYFYCVKDCIIFSRGLIFVSGRKREENNTFFYMLMLTIRERSLML